MSLRRRAARALLRGLIRLGQAWSSMPPMWGIVALEDHVDSDMSASDGPPPGHPERLCPEVPPSPVEYQLWSRLGLAPQFGSHAGELPR